MATPAKIVVQEKVASRATSRISLGILFLGCLLFIIAKAIIDPRFDRHFLQILLIGCAVPAALYLLSQFEIAMGVKPFRHAVPLWYSALGVFAVARISNFSVHYEQPLRQALSVDARFIAFSLIYVVVALIIVLSLRLMPAKKEKSLASLMTSAFLSAAPVFLLFYFSLFVLAR